MRILSLREIHGREMERTTVQPLHYTPLTAVKWKNYVGSAALKVSAKKEGRNSTNRQTTTGRRRRRSVVAVDRDLLLFFYFSSVGCIIPALALK